MDNGKSRAPGCLGMELTILEIGRFHYLGRGEVRASEPYYCAKGKTRNFIL